MSPPASIFNDLSEEALRNVVRHISSAPSNSIWTRFVDCEDTLSLLQLEGSISNASRALFTCVQLGQYRVRSNDSNPGSLILRMSDASVSMLTKWIEVAGDTLKSLTFGYSGEHISPEGSQEMLTALQEKFPALRCLDIQEILVGPMADAVLAATQGRLRELLADGSQAPAIANHCEGLRALTLWSTPDGLLDVLRVVGPTLESFEFSPHGISSMVLVREYCPGLSRWV